MGACVVQAQAQPLLPVFTIFNIISDLLVLRMTTHTSFQPKGSAADPNDEELIVSYRTTRGVAELERFHSAAV